MLLGFLAFFLSDRIGDWSANRKIRKQKEAINAKVEEIKDTQKQIDALEAARDQKKGEVVVETQQFAEDLAVREELRKETNQALANYNAAVNAPASNVDRTAEDLKKLLDKLEENQR